MKEKYDFEKIEEYLRDKDSHIFHPIYSHDVYFHAKNISVNKLSLQGKTVEDAIELMNLIKDYLLSENIEFKVGTKARFDMRYLKIGNKEEMDRLTEQSYKAVTIYCPISIEIKDLANKISELIKNYKGHEGVLCPKSYTHYKGAVYYRKDTDENGEYIQPN